MLAAIGFSSDQPKCTSGGLPTRESSSAIVAITCATEAQRVTPMINRSSRFANFHQRAVLELARVAQFGLDEHNRHVVAEPVPLGE